MKAEPCEMDSGWFEGHKNRCLVVGEVGQAHDGSLGTAHALLDVIADAGADAVKFQTHIASAESTPSEPWRVRFSRQDESRYEYWQRMEFTEAQWRGLREHAGERGIGFISSPFSIEAVDLLERTGVSAWKIASGEVGNTDLLSRVAATGVPIIISSGMSSWAELDAAVSICREHRANYCLVQCTTSYPCQPEAWGLNVIGEMGERYGCPVGYSDHSGTIYAGLAAVALGASLVEVHVALSKQAFGPDVPASLTPRQLRHLVEGARQIGLARSRPVDKNQQAAQMEPMRKLFAKSIVVSKALPAGHVLEAADLGFKKPGTGIPPSRISQVLGRRLAHPVVTDQILSFSDLLETLDGRPATRESGPSAEGQSNV